MIKCYLKNCLLVLAVCWFCAVGMAATKTASVTGDWNNTATWGGAAVPGASDVIVVNTGITVTMTGDYTTTGSMTLNGTGTVQMAGYNLTVGSLTASGSATINNGGAAKTLTVGSDNTTTSYTGVLSNAINLVKTGTGTFTMSTATSSFRNVEVTGGTFAVSSGSITLNNEIDNGMRLRATNNNSTINISGGTVNCGSSTVTIGWGTSTCYANFSGGTLTADYLMIGWNGTGVVTVSGGTQTFAGEIRHFDGGNGTLTINGGEIAATYVWNYSAGTGTDFLTVNLNSGGTLQVGKIGMYSTAAGGSHTTTVNLNGGTVKAKSSDNLFDGVSGGGTGQSIAYNETNGTLTINTNGNTSTMVESISDAGPTNLVKTGTGKLVLTGDLGYTGTTTVSGGTLEVGNGGTTGVLSSGNINISGGTLSYNRSDDVNLTTTFSTTTSNGHIENNGSGTLTVSSGNLGMGGTPTLYLGGTGTGVLSKSIASGGATGNLIKDGTGTWTLSSTSNNNNGSLTVSAGTLKLGAAGVIRDDAAVTVNGTLDLNGFSETIGSLAGSGTVDNNSGTGTYTITLGGNNGTTSFSGTMQNTSGTIAITKTGTGTQTLTGTGIDYEGATTVSAGTLVIEDAVNFGQGSTANDFSIAASSVLEFSTVVWDMKLGSNAGGGLDVTGTGTFRKSGALTLSLGEQAASGYLVNMNMTGGTIDIQGGILRNGGWQGGVWTNNKADMNIAAGAKFNMHDGNTVYVDALTGSGTISRNGWGGGTNSFIMGVDNGSGTWSGTIVDDGNAIPIEKQGTGTQVFSGANTYTSTTTITAGTLQLGASGVLSNSTAVTVASGAVLDMNGFSEEIGSLAGAGDVDDVAGAGTVTLTCGGDNSTTTFSGNLKNTTGTVSLDKKGTGIFTLSTANTYSGTTTISAGMLTASHGSALSGGDVTIASGAQIRFWAPSALTFANNFTLNGSSGSADYPTINHDGGAGLVTLNGNITLAGNSEIGVGGSSWNNILINGVISGGFNLTIDEKNSSGDPYTCTFAGANTYSGTTTISGGTLKLGAAGVLSNSTAVSISTGAVMDMNTYSETIGSLAGAGTLDNVSGGGSPVLTCGGDNSSTTFSGVIQNTTGSLSFTKDGSGTMTISGTNTYDGTASIADGVLKLGSSSSLSSTGTLSLAGDGVLDMNTYNASVTNISSSVNTAKITDNDAGTGTSTLTVSAFTTMISCLIEDGATRDLAVKISNNNTSAQLFPGTNANTFSAGLTLLNNAGTGTRMRVTQTITNVGSPGSITSSPYGTGIIYVGEANTDKAGILFDTQASNTLMNAIVINTNVGTDQPGIRIDASASGVTFSGTITANSDDIMFFSPHTTTINVTGQLTGTNGLAINGYSGGSPTVVLNNSGTANNYSGSTSVSNTGCTLKLGRADQIPDGSAVTITGTFDMNSYSETVGSITGAGTIDNVSGGGTSTLTCGGDNTTTTFSGVVQNTSGTVALTKSGTGTLTLSGANTHIGATTVSAGILKLGSTAALGTTAGSTSIASGAALDLNGITYSTAEPLTVSGTGVSSSGVIYNSSGTNSSFAGAITLGAASTFTAGNQITLSGNITPSTQSLTKAGANSLIFSSNSVTVDDFTISAGTLNAGASTINIYGNFVNSGTFTKGTSTVDMKGGSAQNLDDATFNNLTISNTSGGVQLTNNITVDGTLTMSSGVLTTTGSYSITLGSSGSIDESTPSSTAPTSYVTGSISTTRTVLQSVANTFGGMGLSITEDNIASNSTAVTRVTGTALSGGGGNLSIKRYFIVTPVTDAGLDATMLFNYFDHEITGHTEADLRLFKSNDGGSTWQGQGSSVNTGTNQLSLSGIESFSHWTASDNVGAPLPVELLRFEGDNKGGVQQLEWVTASEDGSAYFEVLRSTDGYRYDTVGKVQSHGHSSQINTYGFEDNYRLWGPVYYMLVEYDTDGNANVLDKLVLNPGEREIAGGYKIYPNPARDRAHFNWQVNEYAIYGLDGTLILSGSGSEIIGMEALAPGYYLVMADNQAPLQLIVVD